MDASSISLLAFKVRAYNNLPMLYLLDSVGTKLVCEAVRVSAALLTYLERGEREVLLELFKRVERGETQFMLKVLLLLLYRTSTASL